MPLKGGKSPEVVSENIAEFHKGSTYEATKAKFGKAKADKQAIAVALSKKRESEGPKVHMIDSKIKHLRKKD